MTFYCLLQARHDLWGPKSERVNDTTMSCMKQAMCRQQYYLQLPRMGNGSPIGIVIVSQGRGPTMDCQPKI